MTAAAMLDHDRDYMADWHPAAGRGAARVSDARALVAVASLMDDVARQELTDEQLEIFEMRVHEYSSRQALAQCFADEWTSANAD